MRLLMHEASDCSAPLMFQRSRMIVLPVNPRTELVRQHVPAILAVTLVLLPLSGCSTARKMASVFRPHAVSTAALAADTSTEVVSDEAVATTDAPLAKPAVAQQSLALQSTAERAQKEVAEAEARQAVTLDIDALAQQESRAVEAEIPVEAPIVPVSAESEITPAPAVEPPLLPEPANDKLPEQTSRPVSSSISLAELEALALDNNPTIKQLAASAGKAGDLQYQVGLKPNPKFGYTGNQLADEGTDQHQLYVSQQIVLGDKLELNRRVLGRARQAQMWDVESQRYRVLTDVRLRYYEALAAQKKMELTLDFAEVTRKGVRLSQIRKEALEGSQIEVLQSQIQLDEVELLRQQAEYEYESAWKDLVAIAGVPYLMPAALEGELRPSTADQNWDNLYSMMLGNSPELASAQNRVAEMAALVDRQKVQAIPNLTFELGAGVDNSTDSGMINLNVEAPLPLYNKNQGNISAAYADYCRATQNVERIRLTLKSRLARVAQQYNVARAGVLKYENEILPKAQETLDLSQQAYDAGELNFLQILIVRKTYFESNLEAVKARRDLAQAQVKIDGLLLSGALDAPADFDRDDSLRSQSLDGE